jgi:hypothetical protein
MTAGTPAPLKSALRSTPSVTAAVAMASAPRFALPVASNVYAARPTERDDAASSEVRFAAKPVFFEEGARPAPRGVLSTPAAAPAPVTKEITPPEGRRLTRSALSASVTQQSAVMPQTPVAIKTREQLLSDYLNVCMTRWPFVMVYQCLFSSWICAGEGKPPTPGRRNDGHHDPDDGDDGRSTAGRRKASCCPRRHRSHACASGRWIGIAAATQTRFRSPPQWHQVTKG